MIPERSYSPPGGTASLRAPGGWEWRGSAVVLLAGMALLAPIASMIGTLYLVPRVSGAEDVRELRREVAELRAEVRVLNVRLATYEARR